MSASGGIVIIGAGEAGGRTALQLRENGFDGPITLVGDEAHLPYERPPLSKEALTDAEATAPRLIVSPDVLETAGITFLSSARATSIDRETKTVLLADGKELAYDQLVLATGASPRRLPMAEDLRHCVYLRTHDDSVRIRSRLERGGHVVIVGGGFIGLEIAASARKRGCETTILEAQPRLLMRGVPAEIAELIQHEHEAHGARVLLGASLRAISDVGEQARIELTDGSELLADLVVIGIGAVPNTGLAEAAGLLIDNGIAVDRHLRTSDPAIFAVGDCASFPAELFGGRRIRLESWRSTHDHARIAAANLAGGEAAIDAVPWFWSDQYALGLQVAGLADEGATMVRRDLGDGAFILFSLAADGRLVAASGIGNGNAVARDIRLAEMLIARRAHPDPAQLASPDTKLKALLAA
jgi:3-phenylpropionate/trans-cinnamate dioxygenase ferredoxin reductase subunit